MHDQPLAECLEFKNTVKEHLSGSEERIKTIERHDVLLNQICDAAKWARGCVIGVLSFTFALGAFAAWIKYEQFSIDKRMTNLERKSQIDNRKEIKNLLSEIIKEE